MAPVRKSFQTPFHQTIWDSTSIKLLYECPQKYYLTMIEGWTTTEQSVHLAFGAAVHSAIEAYEYAKVDGQDPMMAMLDSLEASAQTLPKDPQGYKTLPNLFRTMIWYQEQFKDDLFQTVILANGEPAVEVSFKLPLDETYTLSGHLDKIVSLDDEWYIMDHKTSKASLGNYFFSKFANDIQFTVYAIAGHGLFPGKIKGIEINGMAVQKTQSVFARAQTRRDQSVLGEFLTEFSGKLRNELAPYAKEAERRAGLNLDPAAAFPHNWTSCDKFGGCPFADICKLAPDQRSRWLEGSFTRRQELWDPAVSRGRAATRAKEAPLRMAAILGSLEAIAEAKDDA